MHLRRKSVTSKMFIFRSFKKENASVGKLSYSVRLRRKKRSRKQNKSHSRRRVIPPEIVNIPSGLRRKKVKSVNI